PIVQIRAVAHADAGSKQVARKPSRFWAAACPIAMGRRMRELPRRLGNVFLCLSCEPHCVKSPCNCRREKEHSVSVPNAREFSESIASNSLRISRPIRGSSPIIFEKLDVGPNVDSPVQVA